MAHAFETLSEPDKRRHLADVAARALPWWDIPSDARLTLLNISENATYRVDAPTLVAPRILRVHRTGYHTRNAVATELAWMRALEEDAGVTTPRALAGRTGELIHTLATPELAEERMVVMFAFIEGREPAENELLAAFRRLGATAARMHRHARGWRRPPYFERLVWDYDGTVGPRGNWGDWRDGPALTQERLAILERAADLLARRLARFGREPARFGLIHADLRLANLLVTADDTRVIDFDDSGLGWFLYDLASAMSFMEERADLEELIGAWVAGYREEAPLTAEDEAEIPSFLMLRRLAIVAWTGSHADTDLARQLGPEFTAGSVRVAERYLSRCGP